MENYELSEEELQFIMEMTRHEQYIDKLLNKAKTTGKLNSEELGDLECDSKVDYAEFINENDLSTDNKMRLVLVTGEEIRFELSEENKKVGEKIMENLIITEAMIKEYNDEIKELIDKARKTNHLSVDELEMIEMSDFCEDTEILGDGIIETEDWRIILTSGETIDIKLG